MCQNDIKDAVAHVQIERRKSEVDDNIFDALLIRYNFIVCVYFHRLSFVAYTFGFAVMLNANIPVGPKAGLYKK